MLKIAGFNRTIYPMRCFLDIFVINNSDLITSIFHIVMYSILLHERNDVVINLRRNNGH